MEYSQNQSKKKLLGSLETVIETHIDTHIMPILSSKKIHDDVKLQSAMSSYLSYWTLILQKKLPQNQSIIMVFPNDEQANIANTSISIFNDIKKDKEGYDSFSQHAQNSIHLPSWGTTLGTGIAQFSPIRATRASSLFALVLHEPNILLCSIEQWNQLLPSKKELLEYTMCLKLGQDCDPLEVAEKLTQWNYLRVPQVSNEGEFAVRGEVIDIFISKNTNGVGINKPVRIGLDFGKIETIKTFDVVTQITKRNLDKLTLHPRTEFIWNKKHIKILEKNIYTLFPEISSTVLQRTKTTLEEQGYDEWDYLYGYFASNDVSHVSEYFENEPLVLFANYEMLMKQEEFYWNRQRELFLNVGNIQCIPRYSRIEPIIERKISSLSIIPVYRNSNTQSMIKIGDSESQKFAGNMTYFSQYAQQKAQEHNTQIFISCDDNTHIDRIKLLLQGAHSSSVLDEKEKEIPVTFIQSELSQGFVLLSDNIELYTELDILGKKLFHLDSEHTSPIESVQQIESGDLVVHVQYGIGRFVELTRMNLTGVEKDFIKLVYAGDEALYVPIEQMNMVQRYVGQSKEKVSLDSIGGQAWAKKKQKAMKKIEDLSGELLKTHAIRSTATGFRFLKGDEWEDEFIDSFPFEETQDQITAWNEISEDMEKARPMDRLVVGDVGFGKTELAFRAAFRAICSGKQVAFLVPTTILAEQHYYSAIERFSKFPIQIAMLSRFLNQKEQKKVLEELKKGNIDLLIGTHRIIQKDVEYKDLGLCIIDEEHRFGVKDKEFIKKYRGEIDCLALSATPIPRTLYQSIVQLRDMSILTTPPKKRKPIRTFVEKFDEGLISKAIITELDRGGQIFYLHNRISTLEEVQRFIEKLVPQATVLTASGKTSPKDLEDTMYRFIHKGANVLVSTTIIENGIDIPNVNTIIIDRADNYGIAQLYQLRGRVGRSDQTSFAYLLYPDQLDISDIALKRLSTISDNSELGAGFQIAMKDLEARGTGNLLGKEQSGTIFAIGYEHYIKMLDDTMKKVKGIPNPPEPILELSYTGFIPNTYIDDNLVKMEVYKKIVSIKSLEEYNVLINNIEDRYGHIPQEVLNLFWIAKLKILCSSLFINYLKESKLAFELHFSNMSKIPSKNITDMIKKGNIQINPQKGNVLLIPITSKKVSNLEQKYHILHDVLMSIIDTQIDI